MRKLFALTGLITIGLIFWTALGYLMDLSSFRLIFPLCIASILAFFITGFLKNRDENRRFREFLASKEEDKEVQKKLKNERVEPGDKTGRAGVKTYFKERNVGVNWTGASVHGAVPQRRKRKTFLPKNR
jgi:hypothetical protein